MCDTLVVVGADGVLFGKNSDRDANEPQILTWHPAATWPAGSEVRCTSVAIPQVARTAAVVVSRPFWLWGAEMGANEHGVVIGNEAVFTRHKVDADGLRGMDLLRLALERGTTAEEAVQVLVSLVERHGQGGGCGLEDRQFRYHNSFLVADRAGAWVVETADRRWATEHVTHGVRAISNLLTIPGFAEAHTDRLRTAVAAGRTRRACTTTAGAGARGAGDLMRILGDHGAGGPRYSWFNGTLSVPAMHGGGLVAGSVTTASWVSALGETVRHWATACSAPDLALFKPVAVDQVVELGPAPTDREDDSFWWRHERLHRAWLRNPAVLGPRFLPERDAVQAAWLADPPPSAEAFAEDDRRVIEWLGRIADPAVPDVRPWHARWYWDRRARAAARAG